MSALPENVERGLNDFLAAAKTALGKNPGSVVLFGSAAEGRMRATSDVAGIRGISGADLC